MLGLRLLWRQWKAGDLGILLLATFLAVAIVTGLGLFTERLAGSINAQSNKLLGADLVMESDARVDLAAVDVPIGVSSSASTEFMSMLSSGDQFQLCDVWAVDDAYPLKGEIKVTDKPYGETQALTTAPAQGEIWPDGRVLRALNINVGDRVEVGETSLLVTRVLVSTPGEGSSALAPLVLMNKKDLAATNVVQEGSRVDYSYYFAGPQLEIGDLKDQLNEDGIPGRRVYTVKEGQPRVARAIARAEKYLLLAATLGVILAGAAIAIASRRYALEQEQMVAVLKTLGLTSGAIVSVYVVQLTAIAVIATAVGWVAGWVLEYFIVDYVKQALSLTLEPVSGLPLVRGGLTGVVCLLIFAFPPLWNLRGVLPIKVLRREVGQSALKLGQVASIGVLGLLILVSIFTGDLSLTLSLFSGLLLMVLVVGGIAWLIMRGTRAAGMHAGNQWRLATAALRRRALENAFQIVIFTTTLMLFLILYNMKTTLIDGWQSQIPEGTPNYFLININPDEVKEVQGWLKQNDFKDEGLYPIVRARLTHINDQTLAERRREQGRSPRRGSREINLTFADEVPSDNKLLEGEWWPDTTQALVSIESGYAERLRASIGDEMQFDSGSRKFSATISNIREVDWEQMRPNFFLIMTPAVLENMPAEYITSFYAPDSEKSRISELMSRHPTTQLFEIDAVIKQVRTIITQVSAAVESVLWLTIACGALVLIATVRASQFERMQESAILRTLGAPGKLILNAITIEFVLIGLISGALAAVGAEISSWLIQVRVFELESYTPSGIIWWLGPLLGAIIVGVLGVLSCRKVVTQPPVSILRELAS